MNIKGFMALASAGLLAACGGGGSSNTQVEISPERLFLDGAGVARGVAVDGSSVLIMIDDVAGFVDFIQTNGIDNSTSGLAPSNFNVVQSLSTNANLRQGAINSGSIVGNVIIVEDLGGQAFNALIEIPGQEIMIFTRGSKFGSAPSGSFTYSGTFVTGLRSVTPEIEYGSFALTANFNNKTFSINASNAFDTLSGSGSVNTSNGELASNSLVMNTSGTSRTASLYGSLHGNNAESVSGMFHSNEASPVYAGTFVGSR